MHPYNNVFPVRFSSFFKKLSGLALLPVITLGLLSAEADADLIGSYNFQGNLQNSITTPGALPTLTVAGGGSSPEQYGYNADGWYWNNVNQSNGLRMTGVTALSAFSIGIDFTVSESFGFREIISFSTSSKNNGFYIVNNQLALFAGNLDGGGSVVASGGFSPSYTALSVIITRNSAGLIQVYMPDSGTPVFTYMDSGGTFAMGNTLGFFWDDHNENFSPAGSVSQLRIWDTALTSEEVNAAFQAIPEPGTLTLAAAAGATALAFRHLQRRRRS